MVTSSASRRRLFSAIVISAIGAWSLSAVKAPSVWVLRGPTWDASGRGERFEFRRRDHEATVTFGEARVERGSTGLGRRAREAQHRSDAVHLERGDYVTRLVRHAEGLELAWDFAHAPRGEGALRVSLDVPSSTRSSHTGLLLGAAALGHGTWVDASGRRTHLPVRLHQGSATWEVPESVLLATDFPAVLDPMLSPAEPIDSELRNGPGTGEHVTPALAFDGTNWLAVWLDEDSDNGDLRFAAVDGTTGRVLTVPSQVLVSGSSPAPISAPRIAAAGGATGGFLVAWEAGPPANGRVRAARFSSAGVPVGPPFDLGVTGSTGRDVALAWDSGHGRYVAVWKQAQPVALLQVAFVTASQVALPTTLSGPLERPAVACTGTRCLVVYTDLSGGPTSADLRGLVIDGLSTAPLPLCVTAGVQDQATVAASGSDFVVAWADERMNDLYMATVDPMNTVSPPNGRALLGAVGAEEAPTLTCTPLHCFVAWTRPPALPGDTRVVQQTDFDPRGANLLVGRLLSKPQRAASNATASASGTGALLAWQEDLDGAPVIVGRRAVQGSLVGPSSFIISLDRTKQQAVALAASPGAGVLALWTDARNDRGDIAGRVLLAPPGSPDAGVFVLVAESGFQRAPSVAFNGMEWLAVWSDEQGLRATRLSPGTLSASQPLAFGDAGSTSTAIATAGPTAYVAWVQNRTVFGAFLSLGSVSSLTATTPVQLSPGGQECDTVSVASNGGSWVVVFGCVDSVSSQRSLRGSLVSSIAPSQPILIDQRSTPLAQPAITSGAGQLLLTWMEAPAMDENIWGRFLTAQLDAGPPIAIATGPAQEQLPSVAWSPWGFVVAWKRRSGGVDEVEGARVLLDGGLLRWSPMMSDAGRDEPPAVACFAPGRCLVAADLFDSSAAQRVFVSRVENSRPVASSDLVTAQPGVPRSLPVSGRDDDGDHLTLRPVSQPLKGSLDASTPNWTYTADAGASGPDLVQYVASDGVDQSVPDRISITITGDGGSTGGGAGGGGATAGGLAGGGAAGGGATAGGVAGGGATAGGVAGGGATAGGVAGGGATGGGVAGGQATAGGVPSAGGSASDGGPVEGPPIVFAPACGCTTSDGLHTMLLSLGFALTRRRR
jgi:large repetitive protein